MEASAKDVTEIRPQGKTVTATAEECYLAAIAINPHLERQDLKPVMQYRLGLLAALLEPYATGYEKALQAARREHALVGEDGEPILPRNSDGEPVAAVQVDPAQAEEYEAAVAEIEATVHTLQWDAKLIDARKLESTKKKADGGIPHGGRTLFRLRKFIDLSHYENAEDEEE